MPARRTPKKVVPRHKPVSRRQLKRTPKVITKKKGTSSSWFWLGVLGVGIVIWVVSALYWFHQARILSFSGQVPPTPEVLVTQERPAVPTSVQIERLAIKLPIQTIEIQDGVWPVSATQANYLGSSARPGEPSNIVVYAHNRPQLFGKLHQVELGDFITIQASDSAHRYQVTSLQTVRPETIEVVLPTPTEVLTLYTCTGFLDSQRLIVQAQPVKE